MKNKLRIGLDMDQVLDDFMGPYLKRFGIPKKPTDITKNVQQILSKDKTHISVYNVKLLR